MGEARLSRLQEFIAKNATLWAVAVVALATLAFLPLRPFLGSEQWGWPYLLVVGLVASTTGVWLAVLSAVLAFLAWNFIFIEPYYTLHVADTGDLIQLLAFLVVALSVGLQTGRLRESSEAARTQAARTASLYRLSSEMVLGVSPEEMAADAEQELRQIVDAETAVFWVRGADDASTLMPLPGRPDTVADSSSREAVEHALARHAGPNTFLSGDSTFLVLSTASGDEGVLQVRRRDHLGEEDLLFAESVAHLAAVYLQSRRMSEVAMQASADREAERLRGALVSSVSHELKTPVASLTASVTDLMSRETAPSGGELQECLAAMSGDLNRLDRSIGNLLDASRLEAHAWKPAPTGFEVGELIGTVCSQLEGGLRDRLVFDVPDGLPAIRADFVQVARALRHLVDNALQYSPGAVTIGADALDPAFVRTWVADEGPGVPASERDHLFGRFYRGSAGRQSSSSTGLGLFLAREIVVANGGRIDLEDAEPRGARFVMTLPSLQASTSQAGDREA